MINRHTRLFKQATSETPPPPSPLLGPVDACLVSTNTPRAIRHHDPTNSDGAKTYTECLKLRGSSSSSTTTTSKSSNKNNTSQMDRSEKRAGGKGGAGFGGGGSGSDSFRFPGLWAVARAARTSTSAWMDRRVVHRGHGRRRRRRLAAAGDVDGCSSGGGGVPVGAGGGAFTLLALAGESGLS